jgi:hypothetical protein
MKRYISAILIPCFLLQLYGCYSSNYITIDQLVNEKRQDVKQATFQDSISVDEKHKDIYINTINEELYFFSFSNYYLENDSLIGRGKKIFNYNEESFNGKIALTDILTIEQTEINSTNTLLFISGFILIFGGLIVGAIELGKVSSMGL